MKPLVRIGIIISLLNSHFRELAFKLDDRFSIKSRVFCSVFFIFVSVGLNLTPAYSDFIIAEGCSSYYWKSHTENWQFTGVYPKQQIAELFIFADSAYDNFGKKTVEEGLNFTKENNFADSAKSLLQEGIIARLNAAHYQVEYPLTAVQVENIVNTALLSYDIETMKGWEKILIKYNNNSCPLEDKMV